MSTTRNQKEAAVSFLRLVASGRVGEAYEKYVGPGFRHHNPFFKGDAASLRTAMEENAAKFPNRTLDVQRAIEEGDLVAVHSRVRPGPGMPEAATCHVFRFEGGRAVELWDVGQAVPESSPNENGMF